MRNLTNYNDQFNMKRITSKLLQVALLRGAALAFGCMLTGITALFFNDIYGVIATLLLGAGMIVLIDETITNNLNKK